MRPSLLALLGIALLAGCTPLTPRLDSAQYKKGRGGYRYANVHEETAATGNQTLLLLSFSGGGTRAAAFAYGVLEEMRRARLPDGRSLVDEIDAISSVSGGSFAAAYLALYGQQRFFDRFQADVLERNIEVDYALRILAPWNWPRLWSPWFGRGDIAAEYYENIFGTHTFADLMHRQPFVALNATDIALGAQFSFTQEHFDRLCGDVSNMRIARAVAASSAFPVVFTPLTLTNRPKSVCGYTAPGWVGDAEQDLEVAPENWELARNWRSYEDPAARRYIHLSDGGLADNIGLRAFDQDFVTHDWGLFEALNDPHLKRVVVIAVDAKPRGPSCMDQSAHPPSLPFVLNAAASTPMDNYSSDTVERFQDAFDSATSGNVDLLDLRRRCRQTVVDVCGRTATPDACQAANRGECASIRMPANVKLKLHLIHVRFEAVDSPSDRERLQGIGTRLQLSKGDVQLLIYWARRLLVQSEQYRNVLEEMNATVDPAT